MEPQRVRHDWVTNTSQLERQPLRELWATAWKRGGGWGVGGGVQGSQILEKWEMQSSMHLSRRLLLVTRSRYLIDFSAFLTSGRCKKLCCSVTKLYPTATPWTAAHQAPLSFTISQSLFKFMSIESVMQEIGLIKISPENLIIWWAVLPVSPEH